jgi:hypothetical protein
MSNKAEGHPMVVDEEEEKIIEKEKGHHELSNEEIEEVLQLKRKASPTLM